MSDHYEVHLVHPVELAEGAEYVVGYTDDHRAARLHFEVGAGGWTLESSAEAMGFVKSDISVVVPSHNVALLEVWED